MLTLDSNVKDIINLTIKKKILKHKSKLNTLFINLGYHKNV